jgi:hypothetical protein
MTEGTVRGGCSPLRRRYGELFSAEVAHRLSPAEIHDEMRYLLGAVSS